MTRALLLLTLVSVSVSASCSKPSQNGAAMPKQQDPPPAMDAGPSEAKKAPSMRLELNKPRKLVGGTTIELSSYVIESIAENPDDPKAYPAGSGVVMAIVIDGETVEVSDLSEGYSSTPAAWTKDYRVTLLSHSWENSTVDLRVDRVVDATTLVVKEAMVTREKPLVFGEMKMVFSGHSHRRTTEGQRSPLLMFVSYHQGDNQLAETTLNLFPPEESRWRFRDYEFHMVRHEYEQFAVIDVMKLSLKAVEAEPLAH